MGSRSKTQSVTLLLEQIEAEMLRVNLWSDQKPSTEALNSSQPFCVDTLAFSEWLQWLLLPRLSRMIETSIPLPTECAIHEYATEAFGDINTDILQLLQLIKNLDQTLTTEHQPLSH